MYRVDEQKCIGCGICVSSCPVDAITVLDGKARIDQKKCTSCDRCAEFCPQGAIQSDSEIRRNPFPDQVQRPPSAGFGMGRGMGRGGGKGLGRGPHDGRGHGRGSGGKGRW